MRLIIIVIVLFAVCSRAEALGQDTLRLEKLSVASFSEAVAGVDSAVVIDVRTPGEFAEGHLAGALNINWNGESFVEHAALLDKSTPVYVYCRSGGRSNSAAQKLRELGFSQVFDMEGGMMAWRAASLPETGTATPTEEGMDIDEYNALLHSHDRVLIDFYADWCVPCLKMKPYLERLQQEIGDHVAVIRINVDEHPKIAEELGATIVPVLVLYENSAQTWTHHGYLDEESLRKQLTQ